MAISYTSGQQLGAGVVGASSKTYSMVVPSGTKLALLSFTGNAGGVVTVSSVSRDGQSFTVVGASDEPSRWHWCYALVQPNSGTNDVTITFSGNTDYMSACCDYYAADGTLSLGTPSAVGNDGGTATVTQSVTVGGSTSWLVGGVMQSFGNSPNGGTGTTERTNSSDLHCSHCDSNGIVGTGSQSLEMTGVVGTRLVVVEVLEAGGGGGGGSILPLVAVDMANIANMQDMRG
jgi:hypothetical protein